MRTLILFFLIATLNQLAVAQQHLQKPTQEKALNDTIVFDINQAVYSTNSGVTYIEIPVLLKSTNTAINSFDFWFQFNLAKLTYVSTSSLIVGLDAFSNYNTSNFYLSNTSSGTSINFNVPINTPVINLKFALADACTQVDASDFSNITTLFDGNVSAYKFIAPLAEPIELLSPDPLCTHNYIVFTYPSTIYGSAITNYHWDFNNGVQSFQQTDSTMFNFGTYDVTQEVTTANGCIYVLTKPVTINEGPQAFFTAAFDAGQNAQVFTNQSSIAAGNITDYLWNFGDASANAILENPIHTYQLQGSYLVTLTVTSDNGCSNSYDSLVSSSDGLSDVEQIDMELSPNPTNTTCQIQSETFFKGMLYVKSMTGAIVYQKPIEGNTFDLDFSRFTNGYYLVHLNGNQTQKTFKVIKL